MIRPCLYGIAHEAAGIDTCDPAFRPQAGKIVQFQHARPDEQISAIDLE